MAEINESELTGEFCRQCIDLMDQAMVKIRGCLEQLSLEQIWWRPDRSLNSIGNLILHIDGNLRQWGVVPLSGVVDRRDRESEFGQRSKINADELLSRLSSTLDEARREWDDLSPVKLVTQTRIQGFDVSYLKAILHTSSHFVGHTHQIILLARLQLKTEYRYQWTPDSNRDDLPI